MDLFLLIPTLVFMGIAALCGYLRGKNRSIVRLSCVAAAGLIAYFGSKPLAGLITQKLLPQDFVSDTLGSDAMTIVNNNETLTVLASAIPGMLASIFVFVFAFFVLQLFMYIVGAIIVSKIEKKKEGSGALIGLVCGFLVFALIFSPIISLFALGGNALKQLPKEVIKAADIPEEVTSLLLSYGPVTTVYAGIGGVINNGLTSININGKRLSLTSIASDLVEIINPIYELSEVMDNGDINDFLASDKLADVSDKLYETMKKNPALVEVVDSAINTAIAERIPDSALQNKETMASIADIINRVNANEADIADLIAKEGTKLPESANNLLNEYVERNFSGTDWDADKVAEMINSLKEVNK